MIPRSLSSGALSMFSKSVAELPATLSARTFVIAAVNVVLPWSTCQMVPMLQCGLLLSNLAFAILNVLLVYAPRTGNFCLLTASLRDVGIYQYYIKIYSTCYP